MDDNKYTKAELVVGNRNIPETVRRLVEDYYGIYTKNPDELGFSILEEVLKMDLTESQKDTFNSAFKFNSVGYLFPKNGLIIKRNGGVYNKSTVCRAMEKLQEYGIVRYLNIVEYASFFADFNRSRKPKVKFPEPLHSSFHKHSSYLTRTSYGKKARLRELFNHLGKRGKVYTMPQYAYVRVLYKEEPLPKRVFPKPNYFTPFNLFDFLMSS